MIVVCNFALVPQSKYRIGVDEPGVYKSIFDSDSQMYGGKSASTKRARTEKSEWNGKMYSIALDVSPLSMMVLKAYQK